MEGGIRRLNPDGTVDYTFKGPDSIGLAGADRVYDFLVLEDGRILIAGNFNAVDNVTRRRLAMLLPNGQLDTSWVPETTADGTSRNLKILTIQEDASGRFLVGGNFSTMGGLTRNRLARFLPDGSADSSFPDPAITGQVNALAVDAQGRIYAGGNILQVGATPTAGLVRFLDDGTFDSSWTGPDLKFGNDPGQVRALTLLPDGDLLVGGVFNSSAGLPVSNVVRLFGDRTTPAILRLSGPTYPNEGDDVILSVVAVGNNLSYQWYQDNAILTGQTNAVLQLPSVTSTQDGTYRVDVTQGGTTLPSAPIPFRVRGNTVIDQHPVTTSGVLGASANFRVSAFGQEPLKYQWRKNGINIPGATLFSLTLTNLTPDSSAVYDVIVTGGKGAPVTSSPAFLSVVPSPGSMNFGYPTNSYFLTNNILNGRIEDVAVTPEGKIYIGGVFNTSMIVRRLNLDGTLDEAFAPDDSLFQNTTSGEIRLALQPDGKLVVRGGHPSQGLNQDLLIRFLPSGQVDPSFNQRTFSSLGSVKAIAHHQGGTLVAGSFTDVSGTTWRRLARLQTNGVLDTSFGSASLVADGSVESVAVQSDGSIYIAGSFTTISGQTRNGLARLQANGTLEGDFNPESTLPPGTIGHVVKIRQDNSVFLGTEKQLLHFDASGNLLQDWLIDYAGVQRAYDFLELSFDRMLLANWSSQWGSSFGLRGLAQYQAPGQLDQAFSSKIPFYAKKVVRLPNGKILAAGSNYQDSGIYQTRHYLAIIQGDPLDLGIFSQPTDLTVKNGQSAQFSVFASGTSLLSYQWLKDGTNLTGRTASILNLTGVTPADDGGYQVIVQNSHGSITSRVARLKVLREPEIVSQPVSTNVILSSTIRLQVSAIGASTLSYQWRFNGTNLLNQGPVSGTTTTTLQITNAAFANGGPYEVVVSNSYGSITSAVAQVTVISQPGSVNLAKAAVGGIGGDIYDLLIRTNGNIVAGTLYQVEEMNSDGGREGTFTNIITQTGVSRPVTALANAIDGEFFIGGDFTTLYQGSGTTRYYLAKLGNDGQVDPSWGFFGEWSGGVKVLKLQDDGKLLVGGLLSFYQAKGNLRRYHPDGSLDSSFNPPAGVYDYQVADLDIDSQGRILVARAISGRVQRLLPNGTEDPNWLQVFISGYIYKVIALADGKVLVAGNFSNYQTGDGKRQMVRLMPDGTVDPTFSAPGNLPTVLDAVVQPNNKYVVVGDSNGQGFVARLLEDGSCDMDFGPGGSISANGRVRSVVMQPLGEIIVGGEFSNIGGVNRSRIAWINGDQFDLEFTRQPASLIVDAGQDALFQAEAIGTSDIYYQWRKNFSDIPDKNSNSLLLSNVQESDEAIYDLRITNLSGIKISRPVQLTVLTVPEILQSPLGTNLYTWETLQLTVQAQGASPLAYYWYRNNELLLATGNVATADSATLVRTNLNLNDGGTYHVVLSNSYARLTSAVAVVSITAPPAGRNPILVTPTPHNGTVNSIATDGTGGPCRVATTPN